MHLSLFLGPFSRTPDDDAAVVNLCLEQAVEAAAAGIAMVTFGEQHYSGYEPYTNPFMMAARLAGDLGDTWFGTTIIPLPFHQPLRLAESASVADLLLRGRFVMGTSMGRGGPVPDYANFGLEPSQRKDAFESKLAVLTAAFAHRPSDPPLVVDTPYDKGVLNGRLVPTSWRAGGPQIAIGSNTGATLAMAAARGWPIFLGPCLPTDAAAKFAAHRAAVAAAGFDAAHVERVAARSLVTRNVVLAESDDEAWALAEQMMGRTFWVDRNADGRSMREMAETDLSGHDPALLGGPVPGPKKNPYVANSVFAQSWLLVGSPDTVARQIKEYEALGIGHLNVRTTVGAFEPELMTRMHRLLLDEVLPKVGAERFPGLTPEEVRSAGGDGTE
ncbi:LLM class flavin-dependent oxidoreductase [Kineococcus sp. R8]|uniref:LLM class flavin-dependent oxidoreductase n=1 Tax=Kineococcus siccus TaxID=2696567 RepID=UPI001412819E|nr:LLM class flavin-dependent oxidoreductase [Kineococcus siccus]NAZ82256.1 LLM class flavin-dependent oxidoreductase [Kineococcus siccus]